jgi:hypothetical protein
MNNNTKIRLRLSKNLFESITREILAEAKKGDMSGGAYTEAIKMPKAKKNPEMKATDKMKSMEEMETNVAEAKGSLHKVMSDIKGLSKEDMHKLHATLSKYLGDKD